MTRTRLIAHRGDMTRFPENTRIAIEAALDAGVDGVEFDVQMNARRELVLLHDDCFTRTAGVDRSVFEPLADMPSVHQPDRFGERFFPQPPPRLADALALVAARPGATAWIEIKQESLDHWGVEVVMRALLDAVAQHTLPRVLISYNEDALRFARRESDLPVGLVLKRFDRPQRERAESLQPDYLVCNHTKIHTAPWPGRWEWMLYDIVDPETMSRWTDEGVRLIETGDPHALLAARGEECEADRRR